MQNLRVDTALKLSTLQLHQQLSLYEQSLYFFAFACAGEVSLLFPPTVFVFCCDFLSYCEMMFPHVY